MLMLWIAAMCVLHVLAMMAFEGQSLDDAVWVTLVTATTVGYGDVSAKSAAGRWSTVVFMMIGTIFVLATLAGMLVERAAERRVLRLSGRYPWKLRMHLLIISTAGREPARYLARVIAQIRTDARWRDRPVVLLTHAFDAGGLPAELTDQSVVFHSGDGDTTAELQGGSLAGAAHVVVLGDAGERKSDALVYDVVRRVRDFGYAGPIVAECLDDANRLRLATRPGDVVLRPIREYPELLARAVLAPGAERVVEHLLSAEGEELIAVAVGSRRARWRDVVNSIVDVDAGTPIGVKLGDIVTTPSRGSAEVEFDTLLIVTDPIDQAELRTRVMSALTAAVGKLPQAA